MQTSKKILITTTGVLLAVFVASLMILRSDVQAIYAKQAAEVQLTTVPVEEFNTVHFSGKWSVKIRQGRTYKVEVAFDPQSRYLPQIENREGTLYFFVKGDTSLVVLANVVTPQLTAVEAEYADITLKNFELDSINIKLHASHLKGEENKFVYTNYETTGNSKIEFLDDPFK